jgi:hypothetical protein
MRGRCKLTIWLNATPTGKGTAPPHPALRATFSRQGRREEGVASFSAFGNAGGYFRFSSQMFIL